MADAEAPRGAAAGVWKGVSWGGVLSACRSKAANVTLPQQNQRGNHREPRLLRRSFGQTGGAERSFMGLPRRRSLPPPPLPPLFSSPDSVSFLTSGGRRGAASVRQCASSAGFCRQLFLKKTTWPGEAPPQGGPSPLDPPPPPPPPPPTRRRLAQPTPCSRPPPPPGPASPLLHWRRRRPRSALTGDARFLGHGSPPGTQRRHVTAVAV